MPEFYTPQIDPLHPKRHLTELHTAFGERSVYDSSAYCTRCGSCQQACPTYQIFHQETFSPRGRNQALRLLAEGKLKLTANRDLLLQSVDSCLLCGRCTQACAGKIPTAEHILEMRRALQKRVLPRPLQAILHLRSAAPSLFGSLLRTGLVLRKIGFIGLLRASGILRLKSLNWVTYADELLPKKIPSLKKLLKELPPAEGTPKKIYLPSLEAEFFMPQLALSVLKTAGERTILWHNMSSGLFEYVYGDLRQSKKAVRRLIVRHLKTEKAKLPLITDSIDVYNFLQKAPQLFAGNKFWQKKATAFAKKITFAAELLPKKPLQTKTFATPVRLEPSALFTRESIPAQKSEAILKTLFRKNFVECSYTDADIPAFGYALAKLELHEKIALSAVRTVARTQTGTVFTLSGLSALELDYRLKKFFPSAKAEHIIRLNG
ncbi:MAG: (Fe-S)-binding protein [Elusimicrobium sp.]|uniref:(Fe-S)-binding protein n=1 Tax=Candidatus Avelusimicrobium gallicola TaxID=2562704 RepID=A0A928DPJ4_9BACT|nr:(Fe-S)-binding protein [Elusimicrobium sp.]